MATLLIGTYFKRPRAPVDLPNEDGTFTSYFFAPLDARNPDSEHVATVSDAKHQQRLLAIAEGYYISEAQATVEAAHAAAKVMAKPKVVAPVVTVADAASTAPAASAEVPANVDATAIDAGDATVGECPAGTGAPVETGDDKTAAVEADATALLALALKAFKAALPTTHPNVLAAALTQETAKGAEDERPTFVKALRAALKA